jgi:malate/lactate dehydrogenase
VIIWGNHSSTQFPDAAHAQIDGRPAEAVAGEAFTRGDFISTVQKRGAAIMDARGLSSAMSAANAIADHMHDWFLGTRPGEHVSMGVLSNGEYGVPAGIIYSYPVTCKDGEWEIVKGLEISAFARNLMDLTAKELLEEKTTAHSFLD